MGSGKVKVTVPTINLNRLLYETTIPADWVIVKMDIEGAEWDVLPCMAHSSASSNVDALYMEVHPSSWGMIGTTPEGLTAAQFLRDKARDIEEVVTPLMLDGTYLSRNFATLGPVADSRRESHVLCVDSTA